MSTKERRIIAGAAKVQAVLEGTVFDASLNRIRWIFDEFENNVHVSSSGGKDSTVLMELCAIVARERGVKLQVHFLDQEGEYQATIDYMRYLRDERDDIELFWYQIPFRLFNATSYNDHWARVWDPELTDADYIRPREPDSIKENIWGDLMFKKLLSAINKTNGGCTMTGMRCEESPGRRVQMTSIAGYKWATWTSGSLKDGHIMAHPIYDWTYRDVWKAIYDNGWRYNTFYDSMFQHGVKLQEMRVSSFHHEQSLGALDYLQEIEPETWEAATRRLEGVNTYGHVGKDVVKEFTTNRPYMFKTWREYAEYLIDNLIDREVDREAFRHMWAQAERELPHVPAYIIIIEMLTVIMANDVYASKLNTWKIVHKGSNAERRWAEYWEAESAKGRYDELMREEAGRAARRSPDGGEAE